MAPTGPARPDSMGFSQQSLEAAFSEVEPEILRERARRITKSSYALQESLEELQFEQKELYEENARLRNTIELVMCEVNKLNIGAANISDPELQESPLDFVARLWERTKPRDNVVPVSDHIGEIKKPLANPTDTAAPDFRQVALDISEAWTSFLHTGPTLPVTPAQTTEHALDFDENERHPTVSSLFSYFLSPNIGCSLGPSSAGPGLPDETEAFLCSGSREPAKTDGISVVSDVPAAVHCDDQIEELEPFDLHGTVSSDGDSANVKTTEEDIHATVLIEAQLTLDDGVAVPCRVSAADRCKEVAQRFVEDQSLKAVFVAPLTAFLMEVENNAERFPVQVAANLADIRQNYSNCSSPVTN